MKRNDWILIISILLYSFLFYNETAGINFLIFNIAMVVFLIMRDKTLLKYTKWLIVAAGCLVSSFSIAWHGNLLSVIANISSLSILSGLSYNTNSSVMLSLLFSIYSYLSSPVFMVVDYMEKRMSQPNEKRGGLRKLVLVLIPISVAVIFFFIYRSSNALFDALADKINLDFISWNWIFFTFWGSLLLYGFFYYKRISAMIVLDDNISVNLSPSQDTKSNFFGHDVSIIDENFSGVLLFVLLNILLLIVNVLDINFLFGGQKLPLGVNYKQFVHQGVNMLIVSIIVAIAIILFFFRGGLNFYIKNKTIKTLACLWVAQNAFMVFSTVCRNNLYINEYGLTYKRIGVYIYLLLTLIGLATTLVKVLKNKNNMYLFRRNGWIFYGFLILFTLPNWERIVTQYDIRHLKNPDTNYLLSISNSNLADLLPLYEKNLGHTSTSADTMRLMQYFNIEYCRKVVSALYAHNLYDWKSWYYDETTMYNGIRSSDFADKITALNLWDRDINEESIKELKIFRNVQDLQVHCRNIYSVAALEEFPYVQKLDLTGSSVFDISEIGKFRNLQYLYLENVPIMDYTPLFNLKDLKELHLGYVNDSVYKMIRYNMPRTKVLNN